MVIVLKVLYRRGFKTINIVDCKYHSQTKAVLYSL